MSSRIEEKDHRATMPGDGARREDRIGISTFRGGRALLPYLEKGRRRKCEAPSYSLSLARAFRSSIHICLLALPQ